MAKLYSETYTITLSKLIKESIPLTDLDAMSEEVRGALEEAIAGMIDGFLVEIERSN